MTNRSSREAWGRLLALARNRHAGYFTAKEAAELGYGYAHLSYHVHVGNIERVGHGVYRLPDLPVPEHDDLVQLTLWSRDRAGRPRAVVSHVTALVVHDLTDLLPRRVHLTVPPGFAKKAPRGCVLHRARLAKAEIEERGGFRVTKPLRTLLDGAVAPDVPEDELIQAVRLALERGLVPRDQLIAAVEDRPEGKPILRALARGT